MPDRDFLGRFGCFFLVFFVLFSGALIDRLGVNLVWDYLPVVIVGVAIFALIIAVEMKD